MEEKNKMIPVDDIPKIPHETRDPLYLAIKQAVTELRETLIDQIKLIEQDSYIERFENNGENNAIILDRVTRNKLLQGFDLLWKYEGMRAGVRRELEKHIYDRNKKFTIAPKFILLYPLKEFSDLTVSNYWLFARDITKNFDTLFSQILADTMKVINHSLLATFEKDLITIHVVKNTNI